MVNKMKKNGIRLLKEINFHEARIYDIQKKGKDVSLQIAPIEERPFLLKLISITNINELNQLKDEILFYLEITKTKYNLLFTFILLDGLKRLEVVCLNAEYEEYIPQFRALDKDEKLILIAFTSNNLLESDLIRVFSEMKNTNISSKIQKLSKLGLIVKKGEMYFLTFYGNALIQSFGDFEELSEYFGERLNKHLKKEGIIE